LKLGIIDLRHIPNWTILEVALLRSLICGFHGDTIKAVKTWNDRPSCVAIDL
jgi:hypothetical protein